MFEVFLYQAPRWPHDWLCRFCTTSSGIRTATMACAENATDAASRRVRPSRRGLRSENDQGFWTAADGWTVRRRSPSDQIAQRRAELHQARTASDESVPLSNRIRAGQNQIAMHERDLKASWLSRTAWTSTEPRWKTSRRRRKSDGTNWNICTSRSVPRSRGHAAGSHVPRGKGQP